MKVVGFTILRNGVLMDYPFREAIRSALPLCERFIVSVGQSEDDTLAQVERLAVQYPQIEIRQSHWDLTQRKGGYTLAVETNKVLDQLPPADWVLYLQADEVLHEADYPAIRQAMSQHLADKRVEGLVFDYVHFYGSYAWVGISRRWYRREVRIIRPWPEIRSYQDAQGFRKNGHKLWVKPAQARVFHYGWVRPPELQAQKLRQLHRYWHQDDWIEAAVGQGFCYEVNDRLQRFTGTHPAVMQERIAQAHWLFHYDPHRVRLPLKERLSYWFETRTGWRIGEFRNYRLLP